MRPKKVLKYTKLKLKPSILRKYFQKTQKVSLFNSQLCLFPSKLKSRWDGAYIFLKVNEHGAIKILDPRNGKTDLVNGQCLSPI